MSVLILDSTSSLIQVGIWNFDGSWISFESSTENALTSLFICIKKCLQKARLFLKDLKKIFYCEGPGSILGIRIVIMLIKTWLSIPKINHILIYSYTSFDMAISLTSLRFNYYCDEIFIITPFLDEQWLIYNKGKANKVEVVNNQILTEKTFFLQQKLSYKKKLTKIPIIIYEFKDFPQIFLNLKIFEENIFDINLKKF